MAWVCSSSLLFLFFTSPLLLLMWLAISRIPPCCLVLGSPNIPIGLSSCLSCSRTPGKGQPVMPRDVCFQGISCTLPKGDDSSTPFCRPHASFTASDVTRYGNGMRKSISQRHGRSQRASVIPDCIPIPWPGRVKTRAQCSEKQLQRASFSRAGSLYAGVAFATRPCLSIEHVPRLPWITGRLTCPCSFSHTLRPPQNLEDGCRFVETLQYSSAEQSAPAGC